MWAFILVFAAGLIFGIYIKNQINKRRLLQFYKEMDAETERKRALRNKKYEKDKAFKRIFYQKVDEMLACEELKDLQPGIEFLIYFSEQIDGTTIYQPLRGFSIVDLQYFLYGLLNWDSIKSLILEHRQIKQVDIISQLNLDKDKTGFFLYTLDKMGVLKKEKQGRYNVYSFVTERINSMSMKNGWRNLFDESARLSTD